jgi:hypothetical protein
MPTYNIYYTSQLQRQSTVWTLLDQVARHRRNYQLHQRLAGPGGFLRPGCECVWGTGQVSVPTIDTDLAREAKVGTGTFRIGDEYTRTIEPACARAAETLRLEHALSKLVNQAYSLTPAEIELMWKTAPPRMPVPRKPT